MPTFIVHAKGFVRETAAELLRDRGLPVVEVASAGEAVDELRHAPSAVLVCSEVPPLAGWVERRRVVLLDGVDEEDVLLLLEGGADVTRPEQGTVDAFLHAALAGPTSGAAVAPTPADGDGPPLLTRRQLEVVALIARGLTSEEIAHELGLRPKTVENYKQRVFLRLGVQNQAHAVARCARLGLMPHSHGHHLAS